MSFVFRAMLGSMFLLVMALPLRADDADTAKAIIEKAIKAAGSEEKLAKLKAATMKFKGIIHQPDMNISFTGEIVSQGADQTRVVIQADVNGQAFTITEVLNRDKGWKKEQDAAKEMSADELKEAQNGANENWIASLVPLKDKALPNLPAVVQAAPLIVPVLPAPDASAVMLPLPSLKPYAAIMVSASR